MYRFVPLVTWPGVRTKNSQRSRFDSSYRQTMELLERELRHLQARHVVIQLDCDEREIRRDGLPRADARVRGPGVVLSFESSKGAISFPCDTYLDWQDNLRAIALALEALRAVDRYGVTQNGEQYRGWTALPDRTAAAPFQTREEAIAWIYAQAELPRREPFDKARRLAASRCHPDRNGGKTGPWVLYQRALALCGE